MAQSLQRVGTKLELNLFLCGKSGIALVDVLRNFNNGMLGDNNNYVDN
jgi:hypothetical protein